MEFYYHIARCRWTNKPKIYIAFSLIWLVPESIYPFWTYAEAQKVLDRWDS